MGLRSSSARDRGAPLLSAKVKLHIFGLATMLTLVLCTTALIAVNLHQAVMFVFGLWGMLLALLNPLQLLILFLVQVPLVPRWGIFVQWRVPDLMTPVALLCAAGALARALALRRRDLLRPRTVDVLLAVFVAALLLSVHPGETAAMRKHILRSIAVPALLYYSVRWLSPGRRGTMTLLGALCLASMGLSLVMLAQAATRSTIFYGPVIGKYATGRVFQPGGALGSPRLAGALLAAVLPLYLYFGQLAGSAQGPVRDYGRMVGWTRVLAVPGALLALMAVALCLERAVWMAGAVALLPCLAVRGLRRRAFVLGAAVAFAPLLLFSLSGDRWLSQRILESQNVEDRTRMLRGGLNVLRSEEWDPIRGIGFGRFAEVGHLYWPPRAGIDGRWAEADRGRHMHNDYLNILVESGLLGATAFYLLVGAILFRFGGLLWRARRRAGGAARDPMFDAPLALTLLGGALAVLLMAAFHNTLGEAQLLAVFWVFVGLAVAEAPFYFDRED